MQLLGIYRDLVRIGALALIVAVSASLAQSTSTDSPATTVSASSAESTQSTSTDSPATTGSAGSTTTDITSEAPATTTEMPESPTTGTIDTTGAAPNTTNMPDNSGTSRGSTPSPVTDQPMEHTQPPATENMLSDGMTSTSGSTAVNQATVRCFTCFANLTTDECYMQPNGSQHCASGEHCWTDAYYEADQFVNLTRSCRTPICSDTSRENQCKETKGIKLCTQCCSDDLCNQKDAGTAALVPSGILLSALVVLSIISW